MMKNRAQRTTNRKPGQMTQQRELRVEKKRGALLIGTLAAVEWGDSGEWVKRKFTANFAFSSHSPP